MIVMAAALCFATAADAQTNVYRWVDKDGKVQYSDTPPPKDATNATQKSMGGGGNACGPESSGPVITSGASASGGVSEARGRSGGKRWRSSEWRISASGGSAEGITREMLAP